jgi:2-dehydrotetronate isomerase
MRISANLGFLYADLSMPMRIDAAARAGFDAVEFHWPYDTSPKALRRALGDAGLPGLSLNTRRGAEESGDFGLTAVPNRGAEARALLESAIGYAADAGIGAVHVMAGKASGADAEGAFVEALEYACELAASAEIGLLIEPLNARDVPGYFLTSTSHARAIIDAVARPELRMMYDFYHMQIMQGDHVATIGAHRAHIGHYQIAAVPGRTEPDAGELDFHWLIERLGLRDTWIGAEYLPQRDPGDWLRHFRLHAVRHEGDQKSAAAAGTGMAQARNVEGAADEQG